MPEFSNIKDFKVLAFGDKFLIGDEYRYIPFFESDEDFRGAVATVEFALFKTPNGFHAVGKVLVDAEGKRKWFEAWKRQYPDSDYMMNNWNFLRPASSDEAGLILNLAKSLAGKRPRMVDYYRDKRVFERYFAKVAGGRLDGSNG